MSFYLNNFPSLAQERSLPLLLINDKKKTLSFIFLNESAKEALSPHNNFLYHLKPHWLDRCTWCANNPFSTGPPPSREFLPPKYCSWPKTVLGGVSILQQKVTFPICFQRKLWLDCQLLAHGWTSPSLIFACRILLNSQVLLHRDFLVDQTQNIFHNEERRKLTRKLQKGC